MTDWKVIGIKRFSGWRQFELTQDKIAVRKRENCGFGASPECFGLASLDAAEFERVVLCQL